MTGPAEQRWAPAPGGADPGGPPRRAHAAHSLPIGRLFGIPLELHWSFLLLVPLVVLWGLPGGAAGVITGVIWIGALFASVVVHELAHCLVARRRGGDVLGILLLPIGGLSRMERIPKEPRDEAAVAVAGPATSVVLGVVLLAIGALAFGGSLWPPTLVSGTWLVRLGWMNLLLAAFNLVPALPMDGGRVLRAVLAGRMPRVRATRIAASIAKVIAGGLVVAGVFLPSIWLVVIGVFVYLGASGEETQARIDQRGDGGSPGQGPHAQDPSQWPPPQWPQPQWPPPPASDPYAGAPQWPPPQWPPPPPPARGDESALDVPVERRGPDAGGAEPGGERVGQHH